jgi:hypothetical protein
MPQVCIIASRTDVDWQVGLPCWLTQIT